jgi:hypothetical protein
MIQNNMMGCLMLCVIAYVLQITALMTNFWLKADTVVTSSDSPNPMIDKSYHGLWKDCAKGNDGVMKCEKSMLPDLFPDLKNSIKATQVFAIAGCVFGLLAIIGMFTLTMKNSCILLTLGGVCSLVSSTIWYVKINKNQTNTYQKKLDETHTQTNTAQFKPKVSYSFYMNTVGGLMALVMGGMTLYKGKRMI